MTSLETYLRALGGSWYVVFVYRHQPPFPRPTREDAELCLRIRQDLALSVVRHYEVCYVDASGTSSGWHGSWTPVGENTLVVKFRYNGLHEYDHRFHLSDGYLERRCGIRQRIRFWYGPNLYIRYGCWSPLSSEIPSLLTRDSHGVTRCIVTSP